MEEPPQFLILVCLQVVKIGLWGGLQGGDYHDINELPQRLTKITIRSGLAIDAISFCYVDINGNARIAGPWGGNGGGHNEVYEILLQAVTYSIRFKLQVV